MNGLFGRKTDEGLWSPRGIGKADIDVWGIFQDEDALEGASTQIHAVVLSVLFRNMPLFVPGGC